MTQEIEREQNPYDDVGEMRKINEEEKKYVLSKFKPPIGPLFGKTRQKIPYVLFGFITRMIEGEDHPTLKDRFGASRRTTKVKYKLSMHCLPMNGVHGDPHTLKTYLGKGYQIIKYYIPDDLEVLKHFQTVNGGNTLLETGHFIDGVLMSQQGRMTNEALKTENERLEKELIEKKASLEKLLKK